MISASDFQFFHSFYLTELKEGGVPIRICGLIKRDSLEDVDIGFAFLPTFWAKGYAYESASAAPAYGKNVLGLNRIVAITAPDNHASVKLLVTEAAALIIRLLSRQLLKG